MDAGDGGAFDERGQAAAAPASTAAATEATSPAMAMRNLPEQMERASRSSTEAAFIMASSSGVADGDAGEFNQSDRIQFAHGIGSFSSRLTTAVSMPRDDAGDAGVDACAEFALRRARRGGRRRARDRRS